MSQVETETLTIKKMPSRKDPEVAFRESGTINFVNVAKSDINTARKWTIQPRSFKGVCMRCSWGGMGLISPLS